MSNRARLIAAGYLTKTLGIDWREGERHFFELLVDGDPANNSGNWQWVAGVGVDASARLQRGAASGAVRSRRSLRQPLGGGHRALGNPAAGEQSASD